MSETQIEKALPSKELQAALCRDHGLCYTVDYIRSIRRYCVRVKNGVFIGREARPSDVVEFLRKNPNFSRRQ